MTESTAMPPVQRAHVTDPTRPAPAVPRIVHRGPRLTIVETRLPKGEPTRTVTRNGRTVLYTDSSQVTEEQRRAGRERARQVMPELVPLLDELNRLTPATA